MNYIKTHARLSDDGVYRYVLTRTWAEPRDRLESVAFLMLNPSTADGKEDDPTIRRCVGFARGLGYKRLCVVNLFAFRATDPSELFKADDPVGPFNDDAIREVCADRTVICAWGSSSATMFRDRPQRVMRILADSKASVACFGKTASGWPRHPLYLKNDAKLETYP